MLPLSSKPPVPPPSRPALPFHVWCSLFLDLCALFFSPTTHALDALFTALEPLSLYTSTNSRIRDTTSEANPPIDLVSRIQSRFPLQNVRPPPLQKHTSSPEAYKKGTTLSLLPVKTKTNYTTYSTSIAFHLPQIQLQPLTLENETKRNSHPHSLHNARIEGSLQREVASTPTSRHMSRRRHPLHTTPIHAHTAERKQTKKEKPPPNPNNGSFYEIFSTVNRSGEGEEWVERKEQGRCKTHKAEAMQQRKFVTAAVWQPPSPSPLSLLSLALWRRSERPLDQVKILWFSLSPVQRSSPGCMNGWASGWSWMACWLGRELG